jgi:hypothetical protein
MEVQYQNLKVVGLLLVLQKSVNNKIVPLIDLHRCGSIIHCPTSMISAFTTIYRDRSMQPSLYIVSIDTYFSIVSDRVVISAVPYRLTNDFYVVIGLSCVRESECKGIQDYIYEVTANYDSILLFFFRLLLLLLLF